MLFVITRCYYKLKTEATTGMTEVCTTISTFLRAVDLHALIRRLQFPPTWHAIRYFPHLHRVHGTTACQRYERGIEVETNVSGIHCLKRSRLCS